MICPQNDLAPIVVHALLPKLWKLRRAKLQFVLITILPQPTARSRRRLNDLESVFAVEDGPRLVNGEHVRQVSRLAGPEILGTAARGAASAVVDREVEVDEGPAEAMGGGGAGGGGDGAVVPLEATGRVARRFPWGATRQIGHCVGLGYRRYAVAEVGEVRGEVRMRGGRDEHLDGVLWLKLRVES